MKEYVVERKMILEVIETGERRNMTIRIGFPYWRPDDEFASCPVEYEGLFESVVDARGVDMLHALALAADVDSMLNYQRNRYRFYWPNGEPYFD